MVGLFVPIFFGRKTKKGFPLLSLTQKQIKHLKMNKTITSSWKPKLEKEFAKPYFKKIEAFLAHQKAQGKTIYPKEENVFAAFNFSDFEEVKVVILGQDPYHGPKQAHGLSFSVPKGEKIPPSLRNIYKELAADVDFIIPKHGNLEDWAAQGVLLLNAVLSVNASEAASHKKVGWENFTDQIIKTLSEEKKNLVFLLWGSFAIKKAALIDENEHLILRAVHPSPLSAHRGFFGCKHFSKTNTFLEKKGIEKIDWELKDGAGQQSLF